MWHKIWNLVRFIVLWLALGLTLTYYAVPNNGLIIVYVIYTLHGWNEVYDCYIRWAKWDK